MFLGLLFPTDFRFPSMLLLLSPAKSLDYETPLPAGLKHTLPPFIDQSSELIDVLRLQTPQSLATLMGLSDKLATLNVARYAAWSPKFTADNARQALFAFNGDVYEGLDAATLSAADIAWAQEHLAMLSGLYGVLRPLDRMQPYRLEMGTRLATAAGSNLYAFWGARIAEHLNQLLKSYPDFSYKEATLNPTNPRDKAVEWEEDSKGDELCGAGRRRLPGR